MSAGTAAGNAGADSALPVEGARPGQGALPGKGRRRFYLGVTAKLVLSVLFALAWTGVSVRISLPWVADLAPHTGPAAAWTVVALAAYLPGFIVALMTMSLVLDRQPQLAVEDPVTALTVVIAARNEEAGIAATVRGVAAAHYSGSVAIILADNGSTDATRERALEAAAVAAVPLRVVREEKPGKSNALNAALAYVTTPYVITVDADTILHREALQRLISRLESSLPDTVAVAGSVLVRNSRTNLLTRMQEWDYYLGIAGVKRMQGLYQSTLVAQGAFSVYRTAELLRIGGWPDAIGEDIVVTWRLMEGGNRVVFEPTAVAFTDAPSRTRHFFRQRARWARGMFEGIRAVPPWRQSRGLTKFVAGLDLLIPLLDIGYVLVWLPGLALFLFGIPAVVSVWTLSVLPVTLIVYGALRHYQSRKVFGPLGLSVRKNRFGYLGFLLAYQALCSSASLVGYSQFLAGSARRWK